MSANSDTVTSRLGAAAPAALVHARRITHAAVQPVSRAARANIAAAADDSHSNVGWDPAASAFVSHPLGPSGIVAAYGVLDRRYTLRSGEKDVARSEPLGAADGAAWIDAELAKARLVPASEADMPYELDGATLSAAVQGGSDEASALDALAAWYDLAHAAFTAFAAEQASIEPGPSPVRCWPHHFDIATYVSLEAGSAEDARGIGVGLSPGDEAYAQPYIYVNPWPHLDPAALGEPPAPGHWHTEGFVGAIATGDELLATGDPVSAAASFVASAFAAGRATLGV